MKANATPRVLGVLSGLMMFAACSPVFALESSGCPDLRGHYRVDGFGPVLGDALEALGLEMAGFQNSEVKVTGDGVSVLAFWIKSGSSSPMSSKPLVVLNRGSHYDCVGGAIVLKRKVPTSRQTSEGWLEGESTVQLTRAGGGLGLGAAFRGGQRTTLYSYDSARISFPKWGTTQSVGGGIRWPNISEPRPFSETYVAPPESQRVTRAREVLTSAIGARRRHISVDCKDSGDRMCSPASTHRTVRRRASPSRIACATAGISPIDVKRAPVWSNEPLVSMQFAVRHRRTLGSEADLAGIPACLRVQQEIERTQPADGQRAPGSNKTLAIIMSRR
jgi:hypothetical protein